MLNNMIYTKEELKALNEVEGIVYTITNMITNKVIYVGETMRTWNERYKAQEGLVGAERINMTNANELVNKQIKEYGVENFKVDIVWQLDNSIRKDVNIIKKSEAIGLYCYNTRGRLCQYKNEEDIINEKRLLLHEAIEVCKHRSYKYNGGCNIDCDNMFGVAFYATKSKKERKRILHDYVQHTRSNITGRYGIATQYLYLQDYYSYSFTTHLKMWNELNKTEIEDFREMFKQMGIDVAIKHKSYRPNAETRINKYFKESKKLTRSFSCYWNIVGKPSIFKMEEINNLDFMFGKNFIHNYILGGVVNVRKYYKDLQIVFANEGYIRLGRKINMKFYC